MTNASAGALHRMVLPVSVVVVGDGIVTGAIVVSTDVVDGATVVVASVPSSTLSWLRAALPHWAQINIDDVTASPLHTGCTHPGCAVEREGARSYRGGPSTFSNQ